MIDLEKRKRIMSRSLGLGHCICNPKQPCPCDLFKSKNVCLCAGERIQDAAEDVELTRTVENAGCASKISQSDLKKVLKGLPEIDDPRLLVGSSTCDDAGVFKISADRALVQSVDVFTPVVDDAYNFGEIAAANSVSDIYAMGGKPLTALSIVSFPIETLSYKVMNRMLFGGIAKMQEAGAIVLGGHSIKDNEVKFGFAVTGIINPRNIMTNDGARVGDALVLTKPLGVGIIVFARQLGKASAQALATAARSMSELNKTASELMVRMQAHAATDVTGFGLLGHLAEMVVQSGVTAEIDASSVPIFEEAMDYVRQGLISGAVERNREYASRFVRRHSEVSENLEHVFYDPQTSGGLLIAIGEQKAGALVEKLKEKGAGAAAVIGHIKARSKGSIILKG